MPGTDRDLEKAGRRDDPLLRKYDGGSYSVHAIHMARTSMTVHMQLSQMADQKASLLLGATFVVFTIAVGQASSGNYQATLLVLALAAFVSAMFSVAAVVPKIMGRPPKGGQANILFFGVFSHLTEEEFIDRLMQASETDGRVLSTMLRDIHQNGMVLQTRKYRFLGYAYRSFQAGLVVTLAIFLFESRQQIAAFFAA